MDERTRAARARMTGWLAALAAVSASCAFFVFVLQVVATGPDEYKPWTPISLDDPAGPFDAIKRARLSDPAICEAALSRSAAEIRPAEPHSDDRGCGWERAVVIERSLHAYSAPQPMVARCPLAATLYLWERRVVAPAAERHFGAPIERVEHYGVYSCRPVNNRAGARLSEHAHANAVDVAGFRLADGRVITVAGGWNGAPDEAAFLREIRDGACGLFSGVIGPDGDAAHADHFHLDSGRWRYCR